MSRNDVTVRIDNRFENFAVILLSWMRGGPQFSFRRSLILSILTKNKKQNLYVRSYKYFAFYALVRPKFSFLDSYVSFFKVYFTSEKDISCKSIFSNYSSKANNCFSIISELKNRENFWGLHLFSFRIFPLENEPGDPPFFFFCLFGKSRSLPFCVAVQKSVRGNILGANVLKCEMRLFAVHCAVLVLI